MNFSKNSLNLLTLYLFIIINGVYHVQSITNKQCKEMIKKAFGENKTALKCTMYIFNCGGNLYNLNFETSNYIDCTQRNKLFPEKEEGEDKQNHMPVYEYNKYLSDHLNFDCFSSPNVYCNSNEYQLLPKIYVETHENITFNKSHTSKKILTLPEQSGESQENITFKKPGDPKECLKNIYDTLALSNQSSESWTVQMFFNKYKNPIKENSASDLYLQKLTYLCIKNHKIFENIKDVGEFCNKYYPPEMRK